MDQKDKISLASVEILFMSNRKLHTFIKIPTDISLKIDIDSRFHMKMLRALNSPPPKKTFFPQGKQSWMSHVS